MNTHTSIRRLLGRSEVRRSAYRVLAIVCAITLAFGLTGASWASTNPRSSLQAGSPYLRAFPVRDSVDGGNWPLGATVHLTIDDPNLGEGPEHEQDATVVISPWDSSATYVVFDFSYDYDLKIGDVVRLTSGSLMSEHVVPFLSITTIDAGKDIVAGRADPDVPVHVFSGSNANVYTTADSTTGDWLANFTGQLDLVPGISGGVDMQVSDGDSAIFNWSVPPPPPSPWFKVLPQWESVEAVNWPSGVEVTATVTHQDLSQCGDSATSSEALVAEIQLPEGCTVAAGDLVTVSGGLLTKEHTVTALEVTWFNVDENWAGGLATPGLKVELWVHGVGTSNIFTSTDGAWGVDLDDVGYDLVPGSGGRATQADSDGDRTEVDWSVPVPPTPWLIAFPENEAVEAWEWPEGATVYLTIDNAPGLEWHGTAAATPWGDPRTYVRFDFPNEYNLQPGDVVTVTDTVTVLRHEVQNLSVTNVDSDADTVTGMAEAGETVQVWPHEGGDLRVEATASEDGVWVANFAGLFEIVPGTGGRSWIMDSLGSATAVDWSAPVPPSPWLTAFPEWDFVEGFEWPVGALVSLSLDDPATEISPDLVGEDTAEPSPWGDPRTYVSFEITVGYDLKPGDLVTLTDGVTPRTMVVQDLEITRVDAGEDTVAGTAKPGAVVNVWPHETGEQLPVEANGEGVWELDFTGIYDVRPGTGGRAEIRDEFYNGTAVDWYVPNPRFTVFPDWEYVEASDWPLGTLVTATVDHPDTSESPDCSAFASSAHPDWDPNAMVAQIQFQDCDIQAGDEVVVSGETATKATTVTNLAVTSVNPVTNVVAGTGATGEVVYVWPHETGQQVSVKAVGGVWQVDFTGMYDIVPGSGGRAQQIDDDGDDTAVDWYLPVPKIIAQITDDWIWAQTFTANSEVTFSVYDVAGGSLVYGPETIQAEADGSAFLELRGYPLDLVPGNHVIVTDGWMTHELTLEDVTFDLFDLTEGLLSGTVPGPYPRPMWVGVGWEDDYRELWFQAEGEAWTANLGGPLPMDFQWVSAEVFDDDGDASEVRPAAIKGDVGIDILPGIRPNLFACRLTSAWLPVAVLSGEGFDATQLDTDSIRFGRTGTEAPVLRTGPNERHLAYAMDVNRDGLKDMVYVFRFGDTGFSCADIPAGQRFANVEGKLTGKVGMVDVLGVDVVRLFRLFGQ